MKIFAFVLLFFCAKLSLAGDNVIVVDRESTVENFGRQMFILEDSAGRMTIEDILKTEFQSMFTVNNTINLNFGNSTDYFWIKLSVNNLGVDPIVLLADQPIIEFFDLYYFEEGEWKNFKSGYSIPLERRVIKFPAPVFPLKSGNETYYIRVKANLLAIPISILPFDKFQRETHFKDLASGVIFGTLLITIIYYLFLGVNLRRVEFYFYCLSVLGYLAANFWLEGYGQYFYTTGYFEMQNLLSSSIVVFLCCYSYLFLELRTKGTPFLKYAYFFFITAYSLMAIVSYFGDATELIFKTWQIFFLALLPLNIFSGIYIGRLEKNKTYFYFSIAYVLFFILACMELVHLNLGLPHYLPITYVSLSYVSESVLLGYGLSKKLEGEFRKIGEAKEIATAENLQLIKTQKSVLEKVVEERTQQLTEKSQALERQNMILKNLNEEKNRLVHIVSHDLKTPISHIEGFANILKMDAHASIEERTHFLNKIINSASRSNKMILNLLNLDALENGGLKITLEDFDINPMLFELVDNFSVQALGKGISINFVPAETPLILFVDKSLLYQILVNLLSNAVKFSAPGSNVFIEAVEKADSITISVKDEGPGIGEDDVRKLFSRFQRLTAQPTAGENSTGLGLSIAKQFVESMGGKIWCETNLGHGAKFLVSFNKVQSSSKQYNHAVDSEKK